jgi:hypothetical protein
MRRGRRRGSAAGKRRDLGITLFGLGSVYLGERHCADTAMASGQDNGVKLGRLRSIVDELHTMPVWDGLVSGSD